MVQIHLFSFMIPILIAGLCVLVNMEYRVTEAHFCQLKKKKDEKIPILSLNYEIKSGSYAIESQN